MIDAPTQSLVCDVIRRESRSLLQYVADAYPWTTPEARETLAGLMRLIDEERQAVIELSRLLARYRIPPPMLGNYPVWFTNVNFLSLDHLLPKLVERQKLMIGDLERDLTCVVDDEVRAALEKMLAMKQRHLEALEAKQRQLQATSEPPQPAAVS